MYDRTQHAIGLADHMGKLFRQMFPDSHIARKYGSGRTKSTHIVDALGTDTSGKILHCTAPFSMATDGSTDYEDVKLYPICVRYFDEALRKVM